MLLFGFLEECDLGPLCSSPDRSSEQGYLYTQGLASTYGDVCCWWLGPWDAVIRIFHPTCIKPVLFAPGRNPPGHSFPVAQGSVLPPAGGLTQVQTRGAASVSLDPHLPYLPSCLLIPRVCLCDIFCMAIPGHIYVSACVLFVCSHLGSNKDGLSHVWGSVVAKDV